MKTNTSVGSVPSRRMSIVAAVTLALVAASAGAASGQQEQLPDVTMTAGPTNGSQGFADIGAPSTNTGNINTATTFTIGNLTSTGAQAGYFSGLTTQIFGPEAFDPSVPTSLSFA
ncbi:MAG: hypothetical protein ACKO4Z_03260, partial [Planctomycetota bacterium]